jgi:glycosyltransferase involved in cell wall biosynthesis
VFFTVSEFLRRSLIEDYGLEPERAVRVGGGCNSLAPSLESKRWDAGVALFVGANWSVKGGPTLLTAWESVHRRLPGAELWIVGPGDPQAPEQPGVRWLGFVGDRTALAELYERASVFVLPSYYEAWGHVLVEAMGHGLPCVGTGVGAMPELIEDGRSGLLVQPGEPEPLADALVALLGDPARAESLGRRGYERVGEDLTWELVAERMAPHLAAAVRN